MDEARRDDIIRVLVRRPISRGQHYALKALLEAHDFMWSQDLVRARFGDDAPRRGPGLWAALARRINETALQTADRPSIDLMADTRLGHTGASEYRASPELRAAVEALPELAERLALSYAELADEEFPASYSPPPGFRRIPDTVAKAPAPETPELPLPANAALPSLDALLAAADRSDVMDMVWHNTELLLAVQGGWRLWQAQPLRFDFWADYWHQPARRVLVAYLAHQWHGGFAPAAAMRGLAQALVAHFDAHDFGFAASVDYASMGGWATVCDALIEHAQRLPPSPDYARLRTAWQLQPATAAEHLTNFLQGLRDDDDWPARWEPSFGRRSVWLPYLGDPQQATLDEWRRFFVAYLATLCSTNAYATGAMTFASVLQNTPTEMMRANLRQWVDAAPKPLVFQSVGRDDTLDEPVDRASYFTVLEVLSMLRMDRVPLANSVSFSMLSAAVERTDRFEVLDAVGARLREALEAAPDLRDQLAALFADWIEDCDAAPRVALESARSVRAQKRAGETDEALAEDRLVQALSVAGREALGALDALSAATVAAHLLLDATIYLGREAPAAAPQTPAIEATAPAAPHSGSQTMLELPEGLRAVGERALAYLRAGMHVLLAGAPGTGKTTIAQFVGYAWDQGLAALPARIPQARLPVTTVANSAWSPFHTVGGLVPAGDGGAMRSQPGVFIDPDRADGAEWFLRPGCLVLDEFNRADLDRCIGELYPLLSDSVPTVYPAGIVGVRAIHAEPRFRVVATVNDATLDDIVFPISEGLARRFQRIELHGASEADLLGFLNLDGLKHPTDRQAAALEAIEALFVTTGDDLVRTVGEADRLPFGAGYFRLAQRWLSGALMLPDASGSERAQAAEVFAAALSTAVRIPRYEAALKARLVKMRQDLA
ncbi:MAG: AAA family ATPase [Myxococcales bacterium]|nr:AAA family ATPase [Myxococcales bacterium]